MNRTTKGALAAGAAGVLLLGGAGTLAYWNDEAPVEAGQVEAGSLDLSDVTCGAEWLEGGQPVAKIVPGDVVTKTCTGTLSLEGDHIAATVTLDDASVAAAETAFNNEVVIDAALTAPSAVVTAEGDTDVTITITVTFDGPAATNASENGLGVLDDLVLEAVQSHQA